MKLDLGGGKNEVPGYLNVDKYGEYADVVADLEYGLPFADRSIEVINASHFFEHINNFVELMNECWRVLKDDGFLMVAVPAFPCEGAVASPAHVRFFTQKTLHLFEDKAKSPGFERKHWVVEANVELPVFMVDKGDQQIFVLMRPDR